MSSGNSVDVYISAGSNIDPEQNLRLAYRELRSRYGELRVSPVYRTRAVGFAGADFLNCVFSLRTAEPAEAVVAVLEALHDEAGRVRSGGRFASRTLDLDLLLYGDAVIPEPPVKVPREDIRKYAFVLKPLADIAPNLCDPLSGETLQALWRAFPGSDEPMERVDLDFVGVG